MISLKNYHKLILGNRILYVRKKDGYWKLIKRNVDGSFSPRKIEKELNNNNYQSFEYNKLIKGKYLYIIFEITGRCNLNCTYCFKNLQNGNNKFKDINIKDLELFVRKLKKVIKINAEINITIEFTGGEPLLVFNYIKKVINSLPKTKRLRFSIKTNGTIYSNKIADFLIKNNIHLCFSIDGTEKSNDKYRKDFDGKGTFDELITNYRNFINRGIKTISNIAVLNDNNQFSEIYELFNKYGIKSTKINPISYSKCKPDNYQQELANNYIEFIKKIIDNNHFFKVPMLRNLINRIINIEKYSQCNSCPSALCHAGVDMLGIRYNLDVFPCLEAAVNEKFKIGNLINDNFFMKIINTDLRPYQFLKRDINIIKKCQSCIFKYFCKGGCSSRSYYKFNDYQSESDNCVFYFNLYKGIFKLLASDKYSEKLLKYVKKYNDLLKGRN